MVHFVTPMLYRTSSTDSEIVTGVSITLLLVALLASAAPAWRAARVDPTVSLRET